MNGEARGPDISTLIGQAKGELRTMPKIPQDEYMGFDRTPGEEPPRAQALGERIAKQHKPGREVPPYTPATPVENVEKPKQTNLDSIRWALVPTGDTTTEESPVLGEKTQEQTDEQRKANLLSRAEAYKKTDHGQYFLSGQVLGRFGHNFRGLSSTINGAMPEELQAMIVLSGDYGYGRESDTYAEQVYYAAASALRKDQNGDSSSWRGIEGYAPEGAAQAVLENAKKAKNNVPLTEDDLTRCMITALACGAPLEALRMASLAKSYIKPPRYEQEPEKYDAGPIAVGKLTTQYGENSFDRAYALSPESAKRQIDAQFATLDQNPKYNDLLQYPGVSLLIEKAKSRIDTRLHKDQSAWYEAQKVRDVSALEATLDTEHLKSLSEQTAIEGGQFEVIEAEVSKRSQEVVDGKIANMIGAELVRRLHPELSVANVVTALRAKALSGEGKVPVYYAHNEFTSIFGVTKETQLSPAERQKRVQDMPTTSTAMEAIVGKEFGWSGGERVKSLVALLKDPRHFTYVLGKEVSGKTGATTAQATREQMAKALIQGVTFLQSICEDESIRNIAERELGLAGYLEPGALSKAQEELQRAFADKRDEQSELTLYDTLLAEGQIESDTGVLELITKVRSREIQVMSDQKTTEVKATIRTSVEAVTQELQDLVKGKEDRDKFLLRQTEATEAKDKLILNQAEAGALQVADSWVERRLHGSWPTTAEKAAKLASIAISIQTKDQDIASLQGEIDKLAEVTTEQIELAQKKAAGIARLAKQAHAIAE